MPAPVSVSSYTGHELVHSQATPRVQEVDDPGLEPCAAVLVSLCVCLDLCLCVFVHCLS